MKVSIVCCYNNKQMYNEWLLSSLQRQQECEYELIGIDNSNKRFDNCAAALNYGVGCATSENIICIHQDFEFTNNHSLASICKIFQSIGEYDVFGAAGAVYDSKAGFSKSIALRKRKCISSLGNLSIDEKIIINFGVDVDTLDECCFCFKKSLWDQHNFSEELCPYWDLYGVEMCLYSHYFLNGRVFVVPMNAIHHSDGNLTKNFYISLYRIMKFYRNKVDRIVTTCVSTTTRFAKMKYYWLCTINYIRSVLKSKKHVI